MNTQLEEEIASIQAEAICTYMQFKPSGEITDEQLQILAVAMYALGHDSGVTKMREACGY